MAQYYIPLNLNLSAGVEYKSKFSVFLLRGKSLVSITRQLDVLQTLRVLKNTICPHRFSLPEQHWLWNRKPADKIWGLVFLYGGEKLSWSREENSSKGHSALAHHTNLLWLYEKMLGDLPLGWTLYTQCVQIPKNAEVCFLIYSWQGYTTWHRKVGVTNRDICKKIAKGQQNYSMGCLNAMLC